MSNSMNRIKTFLSSKKTIRQKLNLLLIFMQSKIKSLHVFGYPFNITMDPCNICNLQCELCPVGVRSKERKQSMMSFETFKKVIDECGSYIWEIDMCNWGEPLMNKDLFKMIRYARGKKISVGTSTNLNYFNDSICNELVVSGLNSLRISLDGASQGSVDKYQKGNNFQLVIENMKKLVGKKKELKSKTPIIEWFFLVTKFNEAEIEKAELLAAEIGVDRIEFGEISCNMGNEVLMSYDAQYNDVKKWLPINGNASKYDYLNKRKRNMKKSCKILWTKTVVHPNGAVSPCCAIWPEKYDFGNINQSSFWNIWNGQKYKEARKIVRGDEREFDDHICSICKKNGAYI